MRTFKAVLFLLGIVFVVAVIGYGIGTMTTTQAAPLSKTQMEIKESADWNSNLRWQVFWWSLTASVAMAAIGGAMYVLALAKNKREHIYADPNTGLWPVVRENKAPLWKSLFGIKDVVENDPNLAIAPTRKIYANGILKVEADTHGVDVMTQAQHAGKSWQVQSNIARRVEGRAQRGMTRAEAELAGGVIDAKRRVVELRESELRQRIEQRPQAQTNNLLPVNFRPLSVQEALAQSTPESWVLGQNQDTGELFTLNIREVVHLGIVGATGTGKTAYVALLMMVNAIRSKWRVIILDGKGGADWSKFAQYVEYYALDYTNVGEMLGQITSEYEQRQAKLNTAQANSVWELTPTPRPTMVLVDEFGAVMDSLKVASPSEHKKVSLNLGNLLRLSRSTGISMVFCDQDPSKWPSAMRANLPVNICFRLGGMKGNSVSEFNLHELQRIAHFQVNGERFHAWPTYQVIDSMLPRIEYKKPKALLTVQSSESSFVRSVNNDRGDSSSTPPPLPNERTERTFEPTDRQRALKEWRAANPGNDRGMQARAIRDLQAQGVDISKSYVCEMWEECQEDK